MESKPNYYVRTLIVILGLLILAMAYISFFLAEPRHQITTGIITLIAIVVILVLSESFNKLSVGKILNLSREIEKKEKESASVKSENKELRQELFKIVSNVQQSQVNNTFNTPPEAWLKMLNVVKAESDDDDDDDDEVESEGSESNSTERSVLDNREQERLAAKERSKLKRNAIDIGLHNFMAKQAFESKFVEKVEFSSAFHAIDPIMDKRVVFDGYMKQGDAEVFIEARHNDMTSMMFFDRLYIMLSKINLYREAKNTNAELLLLLVKTDWGEENKRRNMDDRLLDYFQPAIKNGLLRIERIEVSEEDAISHKDGRQGSLI